MQFPDECRKKGTENRTELCRSDNPMYRPMTKELANSYKRTFVTGVEVRHYMLNMQQPINEWMEKCKSQWNESRNFVFWLNLKGMFKNRIIKEEEVIRAVQEYKEKCANIDEQTSKREYDHGNNVDDSTEVLAKYKWRGKWYMELNTKVDDGWPRYRTRTGSISRRKICKHPANCKQ